MHSPIPSHPPTHNLPQGCLPVLGYITVAIFLQTASVCPNGSVVVLKAQEINLGQCLLELPKQEDA